MAKVPGKRKDSLYTRPEARRKTKAVPGSSRKSVVLGSRGGEVRGQVRGQGMSEARLCGRM